MRPALHLDGRSRRLAWLVAGCLVFSPAAFAQRPLGGGGGGGGGAPAADPDKPLTRVYDVRDLLVPFKQYPFRGSMMSARLSGIPDPVVAEGVPQRGLYAAPPQTQPAAGPAANEREYGLMQLITETVGPDSWRDAGGDVGAIRIGMNGQFIVTQTPDNHRALQQLLAELLRTKGKMVRVRAHWLLLSQAEADKLFPPAGDGQAETALVPVDPAALRGLPPSVMQYHAQTVGFNSQTVHVVSGPARTVVSDVDAQVGTGAVAFDPVVEMVRSGLVLEVTPVVTGDDQRVTLDLYSAFVDTARDGKAIPVRAFAASQPARGAGGGAAAEPGEAGAGAGEVPTLANGVVDRVSTTMQELRTTVQAPLGRPVLIGGMTLDPNVSGQASPQLYLVVEVVASE
jgi:type II secretory pathway component GspD/PulD (secretin)